MLFLVVGFISLVDEIQFMLISCIRSVRVSCQALDIVSVLYFSFVEVHSGTTYLTSLYSLMSPRVLCGLT